MCFFICIKIIKNSFVFVILNPLKVKKSLQKCFLNEMKTVFLFKTKINNFYTYKNFFSKLVQAYSENLNEKNIFFLN